MSLQVEEVETKRKLRSKHDATRAAFRKTKLSMNFDDTGVLYTSLGPF
jgi:hypothetical protein